MPKHIEQLLTDAGLPAEDIQAIISLPEDKQGTFDSKPYAEKINSHFSTIHQNDPKFFDSITVEKLPPVVKKQLESGQYARATNIAKEKIAKALGFTEEEIKDLTTDDYKALDFFVPAITEKWTKSKSGSKETQEQLIEARKQLEKFGPNYEKELDTKYKTQYENESNQKINTALFNAALIGELSSIQGLKIAASDIAKTAHDILLSKFGFERVGDFGIELRQKDNPQMKVLKQNSSQALTLKDALHEIAVERNWVEAEEKKDGKIIKGKVEPGKNGQQTLNVIAPHLQDKISKKIAAEG
jgi:hypothetical protein